MFTLKTRVASNASTDLKDSAAIKMAMTSLGYYDDTKTGLAPYGDHQLFHAIKTFQKDNNLEVDGVIDPQGPTQAKIKEMIKENKSAANAFMIFEKNRQNMIDANTKYADKYFHCIANYEASELGWGGAFDANVLSAARELYGYFKGDGVDDIGKDLKANKYGREASKSGKFKSAREACAVFRPRGLDEKY